ncbi:MAG TPA: T9SS type A sorting domain-containing protein, partial [Ignavibacteria bacterium]
FLSTNNGDSWAEKNWGFSGYPPDIGSITSLNSYMFASWFKGGVYRSTNNGTNWYSYSSGLTYPTWVIKGFNNILYAGTANDNDPNSGWGIFRTTNYGNNWSLLNNSFSNQVVNDFAFSSSYMFTGVRFGDGIFRSSNNGTSWTPTNNGMYDLEVRGLSSSNSYLYAGTYNYYNGGKIFRSSTNGINWEITSNDLQRADINVLVASGTNVYAGTTDSGIYISTNEGINWFKAGRNGLPSYDIRALNTSGTNIYAGVAGDLYMTTNNGLNWRTDTLQIQANGVRDIVFSGANILVGFDIGGVYRSVDNGISWVRVNSGLPYPNTSGLTCMTVNGQNIFAGFYYGKGIFMTTNYGDNWINISNGLSNLSITAVAAIGSDIFIGTDTNTIYHSFNLGVNWSKINPGLSSYPFVPYINKLYISGNYIYAATDKQSVWRRPLSDFVGIKIISSEVPNKFSLSQNYPNPFNPVTKIKFTVANGFPIKTFGNDKGGVFVTLKVFDILGREVATLVNEQLAPGTYEVEWNASQFSSGVYFYQFNAENYIATKKLILLK